MLKHQDYGSLEDRFERQHQYLRISVTDRCNFRCTYCMPSEGLEWKKKEELLTYEEIIRLAGIFCELGVTKIRLTGGEPMVRENLENLIQGLSDLPGLEMLGMTTNGFFLAEKAQLYRQAGLNAVNISLDSLQPDKFLKITRRDALPQVLAGMNAALSAGFDSVKVNVVVMNGVNEDEILDFVRLAEDLPVNIRFIEFMPFRKNQWDMTQVTGYARLKQQVSKAYTLLPILNDKSSVAKDFMLPGFQGTVSFITSMTESFCSNCNRIRLTADGQIKPCLFHPAEINLRDPLREGASDIELVSLIHKALLLKPQAHSPAEFIDAEANRSMVQIGG